MASTTDSLSGLFVPESMRREKNEIQNYQINLPGNGINCRLFRIRPKILGEEVSKGSANYFNQNEEEKSLEVSDAKQKTKPKGDRVMKKLVILLTGVVVFVFCMAVTFNVYAQQGGTQNNPQGATQNNQMSAKRKALEQERQALQQKIQAYRQQEQQLHQQIKELREQLRSMHEQHLQEVSAEREKLQAAIQQLRAEGQEEHRQMGHQHEGQGQQQNSQSSTSPQHK